MTLSKTIKEVILDLNSFSDIILIVFFILIKYFNNLKLLIEYTLDFLLLILRIFNFHFMNK